MTTWQFILQSPLTWLFITLLTLLMFCGRSFAQIVDSTQVNHYGHQLELDIAPGYIFQTKDFLKGDNSKGEKIDIYIEEGDAQTKIVVTDNGGKIPEKIIGFIFDPYFTTSKNGTGLGLYMAKIIIEDKMRGTINVRNNKDNVIFTIKLPHKKV